MVHHPHSIPSEPGTNQETFIKSHQNYQDLFNKLQPIEIHKHD
jgi:hypothetical protein